jgi:hypothetical protein
VAAIHQIGHEILSIDCRSRAERVEGTLSGRFVTLLSLTLEPLFDSLGGGRIDLKSIAGFWRRLSARE